MKTARHTLYNFAGLGLPLVAAAFAMPFLVERLGAPRFGLLALIWAVVSYFGLFDLGLGRTLTQRMAPLLVSGSTSAAGRVAGTAGLVLAALGVIGAGALEALAPSIVRHVPGVPDPHEALRALQILAFALPAVVLTTGLRGALEAAHAFGPVNLIRLPLGLFTFLGPLCVVLWFAPRLDLLSAVLVGGRWLGLAGHWMAVRKSLPLVSRELSADVSELRPLLATGGWLSVGNIVGPLIGYADRFLIATLISAGAVAYYATPNEMVTKLWIVPAALASVLFPRFAAEAEGDDTATSWALAQLGVRWLLVLLLPVTLALALFAREILSLWIDPSFASHSAVVLHWLAAGIFVNCLAHVPLALLQGRGMARAAALLQVIELPPYLAVLAWATVHHGLPGASAVWVARMLVDTSVLFALTLKLRPPSFERTPWLAEGLTAVAALAFFAACAANPSMPMRAGLLLLACLGAAAVLRPWDLPDASV